MTPITIEQWQARPESERDAYCWTWITAPWSSMHAVVRVEPMLGRYMLHFETQGHHTRLEEPGALVYVTEAQARRLGL